MIIIRNVKPDEKQCIDEVVTVHLHAFTGFFLTFMGRGFLKQMYRSYCEYKDSGVLAAEEDGKIVGFLAYSGDLSGLYKYMLKKKLIRFAWYSIGAFFRRPSAIFHICKSFFKPSETKRTEKYVELASIGVEPSAESKGIGTQLIEALKSSVDFNQYEYITLETDAVDNESAIRFYEKNGFVRERMYVAIENRKMYEYRFIGAKQ